MEGLNEFNAMAWFNIKPTFTKKISNGVYEFQPLFEIAGNRSCDFDTSEFSQTLFEFSNDPSKRLHVQM